MFCCLSLHAFFGISPGRSIEGTYALIFYPIVLVAIADTFFAQRALFPLLSLIIGQSLAGLHSVLDTATGQSLPRLFLGAVTESGQLALIAPLACGLAVTLHRFSKVKLSVSNQIQRAALAAISSAALCITAFSKDLFSLSPTISSILVLLLILPMVLLKTSSLNLIGASEVLTTKYSFY